jgi:hypothetical protein
MNQGTQGYSLMKKTEGRKSRDTVSLTQWSIESETNWKELLFIISAISCGAAVGESPHSKEGSWIYCTLYSTLSTALNEISPRVWDWDEQIFAILNFPIDKDFLS